MKKYADKILIFTLILFFACIIIETPFMTDAYEAQIKKREENYKKNKKERFEKLKKEMENQTEE